MKKKAPIYVITFVILILTFTAFNVAANDHFLSRSEETKQKIQTLSKGENDILNHLIKEELFYLEALNNGFHATLDEGIIQSNQYRQILESQSSKIRKTHDQLLEVMGLDEETYWNDYAPKEYQKQLTLQKYTDYLLENYIITGKDIGEQLNHYKN